MCDYWGMHLMIHMWYIYYWHTNVDLLGVWGGRYSTYKYVLGHQTIYQKDHGVGGGGDGGEENISYRLRGVGEEGWGRLIRYFILSLQGNILYLYYIRFQKYMPPIILNKINPNYIYQTTNIILQCNMCSIYF